MSNLNEPSFALHLIKAMLTAVSLAAPGCSFATGVEQEQEAVRTLGYAFDPHVTSNSRIGVSHVGHEPGLGNQTLDDGVATLLRLNVRSAFFYLTPQYQSKYAGQDFGQSDPKSLRELASLAPYRRAFRMFNNVVLTCTADSFSTIGLEIRDHYLTDTQYAANKKEFYDLTTYLMTTYDGTGKRFILKNWEGDWHLLGGYDPNTSVPDGRVTNFARWLRSTQEGIEQARNAMASTSDVKVDFALEMNQIGIVQAGKPNTFLGDVIPRVPSDWVSYSAWESISNRGGPMDPAPIRATVRADLEYIRERSGRPVFVSEYGYAEEGNPGLQADRTRAALRGFEDAGVPLTFYWNTYESLYGLLRTDGNRTPNGAFEALRDEAMVEQVDHPAYFASARATNVTAAYWRVLGRRPDAGGFEYWLQSPASNSSQTMHSYFAQSPECVSMVQQTYERFVGHPPDAGSVDYLVGALAGGSTIYDVSAWLFMDHLDYQTVAPSPGDPVADGEPTQPVSTSPHGLAKGESLQPEQSRCSADGRFCLAYQKDCNLVLYHIASGTPLWASHTGGRTPGVAVMEMNGNLVVYDGSGVEVWASGTNSNAERVDVQDDGNLVIRDAEGNALWASNTGGR